MTRLAVFAFPVSLEFFPAARPTHKQLLTLYNPYDFPVNFRVLCTSPHKFNVVDPEGAISPLSCVDIIIRYSQPSTSHCNGNDKFRISMQDRDTNMLLGRRDIMVKFSSGEPENNSAEGSSNDNFQPISMKGNESMSKQEHVMCNYSLHRGGQPNYIAMSVGVGCIIALLLPTQSEPMGDSALPPYLHLSVNLKLVFSFVLGLVSMVILRP
ncbi:motile sperm domain-containing protein 1-like [Arctopsyche grandis]|uniref:motile sperm domain-containing protein 1-like n=1 Tax=Arctopsyche grandis TaxID=121162 RepID=UPI00406D8FB7